MSEDIEEIKNSLNEKFRLINSYLAEIKQNEEITKKRTDKLKQEIDSLIKKFEPLNKTAEHIIEREIKNIEKIAKKNKKLLITEEEKKTIDLKDGKVSFRTTTPKATIRSKEKAVIELKEAKLGNLIRKIEEPNKEQAIEIALHGKKKEKEKLKEIKNLSITQKEEIIIEPSDMVEYYVAEIKKWPVLS